MAEAARMVCANIFQMTFSSQRWPSGPLGLASLLLPSMPVFTMVGGVLLVCTILSRWRWTRCDLRSFPWSLAQNCKRGNTFQNSVYPSGFVESVWFVVSLHLRHSHNTSWDFHRDRYKGFADCGDFSSSVDPSWSRPPCQDSSRSGSWFPWPCASFPR